ncbi:MAG: hypothetical protein LPK18_09855 [Pseudomonadaceae bacterium]|nr:hypothetical protein [Pseudomonadaceae bacterium]
MHTRELFDPRYQLEAEDREEAPLRIHEEIQLTLRVIDDLVARLGAAQEPRRPER